MYPNLLATSRAVVDFPEPEGPSIAIIIFFKYLMKLIIKFIDFLLKFKIESLKIHSKLKISQSSLSNFAWKNLRY